MENYERDSEPDTYNDEADSIVDISPTEAVIQPMILVQMAFENNSIDRRANVRAVMENHNSMIKDVTHRYKRLESLDSFTDVYEQKKLIKRTAHLYHGAIEKEAMSFNYVTFYYADDSQNVYAQSNGTAHALIMKYGDEDFPEKIAERLLNPEGMKFLAKFPLSGNTTYEQKRFKKPKRSYDIGEQSVRVRFRADLRENASILDPNLNCFVGSNKTIQVDVGERHIQFVCDIKKDGMRNLINHLDRISNGEGTLTTDEEPESNSDAFVQSLKKANVAASKILNDELLTHMKSYVAGSENFDKNLSELELYQRNVHKFAYAENFQIMLKKRKAVALTEIPSLKTVLDAIRQHTPTTMLRNINGININVRVKFDQSGRRKTLFLFNLIEGTMIFENQLFYRINGTWYFMNEDHVRNIHIKFRSFLRDHFIKDLPILQKAWNTSDIEGTYNYLYVNDSQYLVGDDCTYRNVELFDLMIYDPQTRQTYVVYVKRSFNRDTRTLALQAMAAIDIAENIHSCDEQAEANFRQFYKSIEKQYRDKGAILPEYFDTFEKFVDLLRKKKRLTNILAVREKHIQKEIDARDFFDMRDLVQAYHENLNSWDRARIIEYIRKKNDRFHTVDQMCGLIFQWLIGAGYVTEDGYVTSKLLTANRFQTQGQPSDPQNCFVICDPGNDLVDDVIWRKMVQQFSSHFKSTAAKYSLMHMFEKGYDFKICQIPEENSNQYRY